MIASNPTDNITGRSKTIYAVHEPTSVEEIVGIVHSARSSCTPLYPVSKGFNWGYGSRSPVIENCALLDLGKMNRILNAVSISANNPIAVIEPGVTQIQLYEFLQKRCPDLTFNVTGSGRDTSIIGNALDRGVGYMGPRKDDLFGLEVVTGTGEILRTGFRRLGDSSPLAHNHPFGLGPILDGLFFQGNFGIVTSACFRLSPRRPKEVAVSLALHKTSDLPQFINELAHLKRDGLLTSVTHIANRARTRSTLSFGITRYLENECGFSRAGAIKEADQAINAIVTDEWTSLASVTGNGGQVKAALQEIRRRTRSLARLMVITDKFLDLGYAIAHFLRFIPFARANAAAISAMRPLHKLALGVPTDVAIENLLWKFGHSNNRAAELDRSRCGLLFVNPALPLEGRFAAEIVEGMKSVASRYGHTLYMTLNIETTTSLVAIINLLFDRASPEEVERAHNCADALLAYIRSKELEPYRARADMMDQIVASDPDYWKKIRALKQVFDPDNIIAPGRYNLP
ncbi:FAD-binding oxidoreductase [Nitrosovibrio tenuis]|uniref:FAD-binding oxidoreductase n=1 Tax=Nitrosovibrio tenuis TaxID=1233 RepID=UPI0015A559B6|nr:FAD-binding oxidoreductase [Nitrosovibrio tenuis]